jgi:predicted short-subunit dehydrogenase-like oxidoreductase (DUF2520 family)
MPVTQPILRCGVLGLGRLGTCLVRALRAASWPVTAIASARSESARELASELGRDVLPVSGAELGQHAELIFLAVPDARVSEVSEGLPLSAAHALVHTSGVLGLDVLANARTRGARIGVMHPLQAFASGADPTRFKGIHVGIEASDAALVRTLEAIAGALGASTFSLQGIDRAGYHAAAVFASNYVVALHAAATRIWQRAGLPEERARAALAPLTQGAAHAIAQHDLADALTGPLVRGDAATLTRHLQAIASDVPLASLYRALGRELLRLPLALDDAARARLLAALAESD